MDAVKIDVQGAELKDVFLIHDVVDFYKRSSASALLQTDFFFVDDVLLFDSKTWS